MTINSSKITLEFPKILCCLFSPEVENWLQSQSRTWPGPHDRAACSCAMVCNQIPVKQIRWNRVLADWFAWKNVDDTIIFIQYWLLFLFRFVQLTTRISHSNLEVWFTRAPSWQARNISIQLYNTSLMIFNKCLGWNLLGYWKLNFVR